MSSSLPLFPRDPTPILLLRDTHLSFIYLNPNLHTLQLFEYIMRLPGDLEKEEEGRGGDLAKIDMPL